MAKYWLVYPADRSVTIYRLKDNAYGIPFVYGLEVTCGPLAFPELMLALADIFVDLPPLDTAA